MAKKILYNSELFSERFGSIGFKCLERMNPFREEVVKLRYGLDNRTVLSIVQIAERFNCTVERVKSNLAKAEREFKSYGKRYKQALKICCLEWKLCIFADNVLLKYQPLFLKLQEEYIRCYETLLEDVSIEEKTKKYLQEANFKKVGDLLERRSWQTGAVQGIGKNQIKEIKEKLIFLNPD
jgi:predicted DNA-binding protein YlxM (UPF0122 family)